tara:strand:+ start:182 stop:862 length:681 start_codon:yes stop_codon:yes gene_type:complete
LIIITGGSAGIGKAIAQTLREEGELVYTLSRRMIDSKFHIECDITDYESLKKVYRHIKDLNKGKLKALINCAGIASMNLALTTPASVTNKVIQTNLIGTIYSNQIFAPLLIKSGGGKIINFSTIAVPIALKGESIYIASKAGVEGFSKSFANELAGFKITVNCIAPGPIQTNLLKGISEKQISHIINRQIIKRNMYTEDVVSIVKLILSDLSNNITGQILHVGGVA